LLKETALEKSEREGSALDCLRRSRDVWTTILPGAGEYLGVSRVVDRFKIPPRNVLRTNFPMSSELNVKVVHPVRDPVTLLSSYYRKRKGGTFVFLEGT